MVIFKRSQASLRVSHNVALLKTNFAHRKEILVRKKISRKAHELTRRDFIKTSAALGAAILVSGTSRMYAAGTELGLGDERVEA